MEEEEKCLVARFIVSDLSVWLTTVSMEEDENSQTNKLPLLHEQAMELPNSNSNALRGLNSWVVKYSDIPEHSRTDPGHDIDSHPWNGLQLMITHVGNYRLTSRSGPIAFQNRRVFKLPDSTKFKDPLAAGYFDVLWRELNNSLDPFSKMRYLPVTDILVVNVSDFSCRDKLEVQDWIDETLLRNEGYLRGIVIVHNSKNEVDEQFFGKILKQLPVLSQHFSGKIVLCKDLYTDQEFAKAMATAVSLITTTRNEMSEGTAITNRLQLDPLNGRNSVVDIQYTSQWENESPKAVTNPQTRFVFESSTRGMIPESKEQCITQNVSIYWRCATIAALDVLLCGLSTELYRHTAGRSTCIPLSDHITFRSSRCCTKLICCDEESQLLRFSDSHQTLSWLELHSTFVSPAWHRPFGNLHSRSPSILFSGLRCLMVSVMVAPVYYVMFCLPWSTVSTQILLLFVITVCMLAMRSGLRTKRTYPKRLKESKQVWACDAGSLYSLLGATTSHSGSYTHTVHQPPTKVYYTDVITGAIIERSQPKPNLGWWAFFGLVVMAIQGLLFYYVLAKDFVPSHDYSKDWPKISIGLIVMSSLLFPWGVCTSLLTISVPLEKYITALHLVKAVMADDADLGRKKYGDLCSPMGKRGNLGLKIPLHVSSNVFRWWEIYEEVTLQCKYDFAESSGAVPIVLIAVITVTVYITTIWLLGTSVWLQAPVVADGVILAVIFLGLVIRATKLGELKHDLLCMLDQWSKVIQVEKSEIYSILYPFTPDGNLMLQEEDNQQELKRKLNLLTDSESAIRHIRGQLLWKRQEVVAFFPWLGGITFSQTLVYFVVGTLLPAMANGLFLLNRTGK